MATMRGAKALGLADRVGSLEVGKQADVVVVDAGRPHLAPRHDPTSLLVYSAQGGDVCMVLIDGRIVLDDGVLTTIDEEKLLEQAKAQTQSLLRRAGKR
jgi:5-methylthioadenosine/S-adenosylhomocysteine deaminase